MGKWYERSNDMNPPVPAADLAREARDLSIDDLVALHAHLEELMDPHVEMVYGR
jgi:hypothetical protein